MATLEKIVGQKFSTKRGPIRFITGLLNAKPWGPNVRKPKGFRPESFLGTLAGRMEEERFKDDLSAQRDPKYETKKVRIILIKIIRLSYYKKVHIDLSGLRRVRKKNNSY